MTTPKVIGIGAGTIIMLLLILHALVWWVPFAALFIYWLYLMVWMRRGG